MAALVKMSRFVRRGGASEALRCLASSAMESMSRVTGSRLNQSSFNAAE